MTLPAQTGRSSVAHQPGQLYFAWTGTRCANHFGLAGPQELWWQEDALAGDKGPCGRMGKGIVGEHAAPIGAWASTQGEGARRLAHIGQAAEQKAAPATKMSTYLPAGNRTPTSRVTGGDTHHYTNKDGWCAFCPHHHAQCSLASPQLDTKPIVCLPTKQVAEEGLRLTPSLFLPHHEWC